MRNIDTIGFDLLLDKVEYFIKTASVANNKLEAFNIYPNPSNGNYTVEGFKVNSAKVLDLNGRLIANLENVEQNKLDLTNLKNGMYLLQLCDENENEVYRKIVKQ